MTGFFNEFYLSLWRKINSASELGESLWNDWNSFTFLLWWWLLLGVECLCSGVNGVSVVRVRCIALHLTFWRKHSWDTFERGEVSAVIVCAAPAQCDFDSVCFEWVFVCTFIALSEWTQMHRVSKIFRPVDSVRQKTKNIIGSKNQSVSHLFQRIWREVYVDRGPISTYWINDGLMFFVFIRTAIGWLWTDEATKKWLVLLFAHSATIHQ